MHVHNDDGPVVAFGSELGYIYIEAPFSNGTQFYRLLNGKYTTDPDGNKLIFQYDEVVKDSRCMTCSCTCGSLAINQSLKEGT